MDVDLEQAAILNEHKGVLVPVAGVEGGITVRPLTTEDTLDAQVIGDLAEIGKVAFSSMERFQSLLKDGAENVDAQALIGIFAPALQPIKRCLAKCVDRPLASIPHWGTPDILKAFFLQNFTEPRLTPWAGLLQLAGARLKSGRKSSTAPSTPSSSSSTTGTRAGGNTPSTSSSSGSGPASAPNTAPTPADSNSNTLP